LAWKIIFSSQAEKDSIKIDKSPHRKKVFNLLNLLQDNPYRNPPPYEKLTSSENYYSRRINIQHRLVYNIFKEEKIVRVVRMWTHYE